MPTIAWNRLWYQAPDNLCIGSRGTDLLLTFDSFHCYTLESEVISTNVQYRCDYDWLRLAVFDFVASFSL